MSTFRHEIDNPEMKETLNKLGGVIGGALPKGWGFTLLLFQFGEGGQLFYISNGERVDVLNTMREFLQKAGVN